MGLSRQAAYRQWERQKTQEKSQQPRISGKLSVEDSVKLTLVHNKMLQQTLEERNVAEGQIVSSRSVYLPNVALSGQYRRRSWSHPSIPAGLFPGECGAPADRHAEQLLGGSDGYAAALCGRGYHVPRCNSPGLLVSSGRPDGPCGHAGRGLHRRDRLL